MPIKIENLVYIYQKGTPFEKSALKGFSLTVNDGETIGIMGATGSGKSTLLQLLNGLLQPAAGTITIDGLLLGGMKKASLAKLRQQVAMVFQYPEQQIFEEHVYDEVAFGPINMGLDAQAVEERVIKALIQVGLDPAVYRKRSTANLSGGEKRRLAIAGMLASEPRYLLLDEPSAGLDPEMRVLLFENMSELNRLEKMTIIMVSHHLSDLLALCSRIIVLDNGQLVLDVASSKMLDSSEQLAQLGVDLTPAQQVVQQLKQRGWGITRSPRNPEEAGRLIVEKLANKL
ncbi:MAG: ATP-binding cassette domain-containing protein [Syntrophomonadaceae bacterium]|nr:ATP-binding cassette domain-containing protein [Syntrophomonadaceae bacterium]